MEFLSRASIAVLLQFVLVIKLTSASYCEWNTCESWQYCCGNNLCCNDTNALSDCKWKPCESSQYCCGDNMCCSKTDASFYIYTFLCISGALLLLCCIVFYLCRFSWHFGHLVIESIFGNYNNLPRDLESSRTDLTTEEVPNDPPMYADPPPPYSEVMRDRK